MRLWDGGSSSLMGLAFMRLSFTCSWRSRRVFSQTFVEVYSHEKSFPKSKHLNYESIMVLSNCGPWECNQGMSGAQSRFESPCARYVHAILMAHINEHTLLSNVTYVLFDVHSI